MDLDTKLFVRLPQEVIDFLNAEAEKMTRRTGLPKVGASTIARNIIVSEMNRRSKLKRSMRAA